MPKFHPKGSSYQAATYNANFLSAKQKQTLLQELEQFKPIWEMRYSENNPPPEGKVNRQLLRPVYWLGSWQFACHNYYHPPKGIHHRCIKAEPFPPLMTEVVRQIESLVHQNFIEKDVPSQWELNTCLINYYGSKLINDKWEDVARVGEHRDYEPGPVASVSLGERAFFQFVRTANKGQQSQAVLNQWLEDGSLQIFGGDRYKKQLFHRVQRVEDKSKKTIGLKIESFRTRRINLTFRYVPREHIYALSELPEAQVKDVMPYVTELAQYSEFWKAQIPSTCA